MACQGYGNISREEKEEYLRKKMEDMKKKSEEILRRHAEVEADKRNADMLSNMVSTKTQANTHSQTTNVVKNVKNASHVYKEKSSDQLIPEKSVTSHHVEKQWNNQKASEGNAHPAEKLRSSWQMSDENTHSTERLRISRQMSEENVPFRRKDADYRKQKLSEDDGGPPPDPINYLSDPYRDGSFPDVDRNQDRNQDSRRHRSNYGGENFRNVKPIMQQKRNYERQHPPLSSNSNLSMSLQMTGKERKEYENWKAERNKIDEERIARQKTSMGTWKREWDLNKNEHEEAAKKSDNQFYKQPRWISESGDHQQQNEKKSQGNRGHFNPSFDHRFDEKGERSVIVNERNTLTVVKNSEFEDDSVSQTQYQRNQGGKRVFVLKQNASVNEGKSIYNKKDANWKQNDKMSTMSKGDGWEDASATIDGTKCDDDVSSKKDVYPLQQSNNPDREWRTGAKFNQRRNDVDNKYNKGNPSIDLYDKSHKRQKSVNFEDFHDEMTRQDKKFSSDGWQGGRYSNTGRKHEDDWSKSKNDKSRKISDGLENNGSISRMKDTRGRIISDGWEKEEENFGKVNENLQRPSDEVNRDDSFSSSYYEHKQKRFSNQRAKGSSFRGKNSRVYSSSERGKSHFDSRQRENWNPCAVSDDDQRFRRKEGRTAIDDVESQNFERRWQNEDFDHKAGGNRFWEDKRRGSDTRRISRGHGSRGNAFRTNKNNEFQEYHNKNTYNNSQTTDTFKYVDGVKNKKQISNDGWECEYDELQASSENWLEDNKKILDDAWKSGKSATIVNTTENISSQDSSEPDVQKQKVSADTESHDDSWEDVTSGCESELSDQNEGISQTDNHALFAESKFQSVSFDEDLSKGDNKLNTIQWRHETNSKHHSSNTKVMDESDEHQDVKINELGFCKDSTDTFSGVTSERNFSSSRNDSVERILEEVYNDAINSEKNKYVDLQTKSNEISDVFHAGIISNTGCKTSENGTHDDCLIDSLNNIKRNVTEEPLQSSIDIHYVDINVNNEDGVVANNNEDDSSENLHLHSCVYSDDDNTDSCTYEPSDVLSLDNNSRDSICQDNCIQIQPDFSSITVSNATIYESSSDTTVAHSVEIDDSINKLSSNAFVIPSVKSVEESGNSNEVTKASMKKASNQTKVNLNTEVQQICELTAVEDKNERGCAYVTSDLEDSAMAESADRKETFAEIDSSENVVIKDILSSSIKSKEVEDNSTDNVTSEPSIIANTIKKDSSCYEELHQVCSNESTEVSVKHNKLDSDIDMQQLHETPTTEINNTSVYDSVPSESRQNDLEQDTPVSSLSVECTLADKNNTCVLNICTISAMKMIETSSKDSQEWHEKILEPAEASNKDKEVDPSTEMQKIHKTTVVVPSDKQSNDQEGLIIQDKDKINNYAEIVSAYEDSATSDDNIASFYAKDKVKDDNNTNEPSISIMKSAEAIGNSHKEFTHTFNDEKKVDLHMEEQHMYTATDAQIIEESDCQKLLQLMPHKNNSNSVSMPENSVTPKTTESREVVVTPSTYPEHTLGNDITSLKTLNKLEQTKNTECNDIDVSSDSNNAVSSNDVLSVDKNALYLAADVKEKIVTDSEQIKEVSPATSMNSEATEQILINVVSGLDNGNENALNNFTPNVLNIKDPLARTVRKFSATECTTEFAEVLEVTTSIPQRIVLQDIDSAHSMNKVKCEQITSSLNLDVKPPENLIAE